MTTRHAIGAALLLAGGIALFSAAPAFAVETPIPTPSPTPSAPPVEKVCDDLDSGKIDVSGSVTSLEISAPVGNVITEYCVKAGSAQQGDGPVLVVVVPPAQTVVIKHPTGKEISHYSFSYEPAPTTPPTTPPATTPATTPPATTPATTTPTGGGAGLAETGFDGTWLLFAGLGAVAIGSIIVGERLAVRRRGGA